MIETVKVEKIGKSFITKGTNNIVLKNISFSLKAGQVLIITGKNGSGKTTLLKIIAGLLFPDYGRVLIKSLDAVKKEKEVKKFIGFMGSEERTLYWKISGRQNLEFFGALYGIDNKTVADRIGNLVLRLDMKEFIDKPVEDCSLGMKQRLSIARCLLPHPEVVLFDEPLKGLDKRTKEIFLEILGILRKKKYSVIITTHNIEDFAAIKHKKLELSG